VSRPPIRIQRFEEGLRPRSDAPEMSEASRTACERTLTLPVDAGSGLSLSQTPVWRADGKLLVQRALVGSVYMRSPRPAVTRDAERPRHASRSSDIDDVLSTQARRQEERTSGFGGEAAAEEPAAIVRPLFLVRAPTPPRRDDELPSRLVREPYWLGQLHRTLRRPGHGYCGRRSRCARVRKCRTRAVETCRRFGATITVSGRSGVFDGARRDGSDT